MTTTTHTTHNRPSAATTAQRPERRSETLARMYRKAIAEGVQVAKVAGTTDTYAAFSTGDRGAYIVRPGVREAGCTCQGYQRHQYCKHYARALVLHGLMQEPDPEPEPPAPAAARVHIPTREENHELAAWRARPVAVGANRCQGCEVDIYEPLKHGLCDDCLHDALQVWQQQQQPRGEYCISCGTYGVNVRPGTCADCMAADEARLAA